MEQKNPEKLSNEVQDMGPISFRLIFPDLDQCTLSNYIYVWNQSGNLLVVAAFLFVYIWRLFKDLTKLIVNKKKI